MLPKVIARRIRFHHAGAIRAFGSSYTCVTTVKGGEVPCLCAVAGDWVYAQACSIENPCPPDVISVNGNAVRDRILVVNHPHVTGGLAVGVGLGVDVELGPGLVVGVGVGVDVASGMRKA